jgi:CRP-like cAMP-binding protein
MNDLEQYIQHYFGIEDHNIRDLATLFKLERLQKDTYFTQEGNACNKLSFVKSGFLRVFRYVDGKDITQWISTQGDFTTDLSGLIFNQASRWNIQAMTDCELYTIYADDYNNLSTVIPLWDHIEKLFLAKCFITIEERVFSFLSMTAEERYLFLFNYKSELFNQVPLHQIASMLGMTPETLSRIRNKRLS